MLAGIVAMQVEVLKLGASMGRAIQRGTALQSTNEQLRASVATLADDQRIERLAAARGMLMPSPAGVGFLSAAAGSHAQQAIANIHAPSPTSFLALTTANGSVTTAQSTSTPTATPPITPTTSASTPTAAPGSGGATATSLPIQTPSTQSSSSGTPVASSGGAAVPSGN